jgi:phosphoglycerate dehydrogenase-like enzyme
LVNCARGEIIDENALATALNKRWLAGAALDVLEKEPVDPHNPLLTMPNVIVTPHIAGVTVQSSVSRGEQAVRRTLDAFSGNKPMGLVNPDVWPIFLGKIK